MKKGQAIAISSIMKIIIVLAVILIVSLVFPSLIQYGVGVFTDDSVDLSEIESDFRPDSLRTNIPGSSSGTSAGLVEGTGGTQPTIEVIDVRSSIPTTNFAKNRKDTTTHIVIHDTAPCKKALATYQRIGSDISAHYLICSDGKIYYMVDEGDAAYHAPPYNQRSIGIEHESISTVWSAKMMIASARLSADIIKRYGIPAVKPADVVNPGIIGHSQLDDAFPDIYGADHVRTDPHNFEWDTYLKLINGETVTYHGKNIRIPVDSVSEKKSMG